MAALTEMVGKSMNLKHKDGTTELIYIKRQIDSKFATTNQGELVKVDANQRDCELVPEDEPLFLWRGRDVLAFTSLQKYLALAIEHGCTDFHIHGITSVLKRFGEFREEHPERMKSPGSSMGKL